ncbi:MAG: hypothetical protein MK179_18420 [Pirellulaceae bacterium]|nr:hypothetical protein [Pirellulaceae bacterium]
MQRFYCALSGLCDTMVKPPVGDDADCAPVPFYVSITRHGNSIKGIVGQ